MHLSSGCAGDEEMHASLCYKKCKFLTNNRYPIRTTAFSCCQNKPCGFFNQRLSLKICAGFDVSGDSQGGGCPHMSGTCMENEELYLGLCYKKCSLLTSNTYPFRK